MDQQDQQPESHLESSMVSEDHHTNEAFLDEEPENSQVHDDEENHSSRRPLHLELSETEESNVDLPRMLKLLFGLNGLSLSLLTFPIMYILNTRVKVPLPYLPAYGAISFLPYSLKPFYAYLCGLWIKNETPYNRSTHNGNNHHRYLSLFRWLLAMNSIFTLYFCSIPEGGIGMVFVVAFLRGIADSWAEFCLGLTLIDHARENSQSNNNNNNKYETTVSGLQAQAATCRNLGAWLASLVTFLVFVGRRFASEEGSVQLTGTLANTLIIATALIELGGAASVYVWEQKHNNHHNISYEELVATEFPIHDNSNAAVTVPTESDSLRDDENSHPSYSSLEDLSDEEATIATEGSNNLIPASNDWSPRKIANWSLVVFLQCVLVVVALKGPIVEISSHFVWSVLVITLLVGIVIASITLFCKLGSDDDKTNDMATFRVGLFLVLKNAIPSDSAILASFFYSLFGIDQPLLLQFLSFLGMGVSSLSSWSYTRIFSKRFGSGRPLVMLMAGTVTLASLASLLHISVFRIYEYDDYKKTHKLLLMAIVSKFVTTFFDEWAFLPELVLATTSVKVPTTNPSAETNDPEEGAILVTNTPTSSSNNSNNEDQQRIAMEYGTLVSCIDFGDQLGSLLAAPLVAMWQISRENGFEHLDRLIVFCSVANLAVTLGLLPLLWNIGKPKR